MTEEALFYYSIIGIPLGLITLIVVALYAARMLTTQVLVYPIKLIFGELPTYIATRYLFSHKKRNAINIITYVSILGITIVTAALIIILSIFNGFQVIIFDMFDSFDSDIKIVAAKGRSFAYSDSLMGALQAVDGVEMVSPTIENKALIRYYDKQHIVVVKGLKPDFTKLNPVDSLVYKGEFRLRNAQGSPMAVLGGGVADVINADFRDNLTPMELFVADEEKEIMQNPVANLRSEYVFPAGYFSVQLEYDNKYVLVDFDLAERLFKYDGKITGYELKINRCGAANNRPDMNIFQAIGEFFTRDQCYEAAEIKKTLAPMVGDKLKVLTWYEQHQTLYDVMENEKMVAFLVLALIMLLAGVNIVGSLSMTVLEKTRDLAIMKSYGMRRAMVRRVFLAVGFFVGTIGGFAGLAVALVVGIVQVKYGLIKLAGGDSFLIDAWPLEMRLWDFLLIFLTVFGLALLAALFPARKAADISIVQALRK